MWSGLHWMSLCVIPQPLDRLLSSGVTLIIPISVNRVLCLWGVEAEMDGIKQVCVSKKFDFLLFLTGMHLQTQIAAVDYLPCWTTLPGYLSIDFYLIKSPFLPTLPYRIDVLKWFLCLTPETSLLQHVLVWALGWQGGKWSALRLHM